MNMCFILWCKDNYDPFQLMFSSFFTILSILATILLTILTYYIIYNLKPKLKIICACREKYPNKIKISIENIGKFNAVNLRIEVCAFDSDNNYTYHFKVDHNEFLILPGRKNVDNTKIFKVIGIAESAIDYINIPINNIKNINELTLKKEEKEKYSILLNSLDEGKLKLRVRIHSYHEFSGLGKAEEKIFRL